MGSQNLDNKSQKKKISYGKLLIIVIVAEVVYSVAIQPYMIGLRMILDVGVTLLLVLWVADLIKRRKSMNRSESRE